MCVLVSLPSLKQCRNSISSLLCRIGLLVLFTWINSLRNFTKQFFGFGACFARRLLANRNDFETNREPLLAFPDVALDYKCFSALTDEHRKFTKLRVASEVLA